MPNLRLLTIGTIAPEDLAEIGDQPAALVVGDVEAIRELAPLLGKPVRVVVKSEKPSSLDDDSTWGEMRRVSWER